MPTPARSSPTPGSTCAPTPASGRATSPSSWTPSSPAASTSCSCATRAWRRPRSWSTSQVFADACRRHGKLLAVNDRADVAHAIGSDVLHLGQGDLPVPAARAILGDEVLIGRSTHAEAEVDAAAAEPGVDYFCTGPCWPTPTKPGRHAPGPGPRPVRGRARHRTAPGSPSAASTRGNLDEVLDAGARRVVVVRAITEADDPGAAAPRSCAKRSGRAATRSVSRPSGRLASVRRVDNRPIQTGQIVPSSRLGDRRAAG